MSGYKMAFKKAFPYTIPVLTGYLFIGIAFGVMYAEKGYSFLWAMLMSLLVYAGSGQYLAVNFFVPGISLIQVIFMTLMVNVRHIFYGLSLLERFHNMGKKRWYMIFGLTDETYSLVCSGNVPEGVDEKKYFFMLTFLNQCYWIIGSVAGSLLGSLITFNTAGIEFSMTALFLVVFVDQWKSVKNHTSAVVGVGISVVCLLIFGAERFLIPTMIAITVILTILRKKLHIQEIEKEEEKNA